MLRRLCTNTASKDHKIILLSHCYQHTTADIFTHTHTDLHYHHHLTISSHHHHHITLSPQYNHQRAVSIDLSDLFRSNKAAAPGLPSAVPNLGNPWRSCQAILLPNLADICCRHGLQQLQVLTQPHGARYSWSTRTSQGHGLSRPRRPRPPGRLAR